MATKNTGRSLQDILDTQSSSSGKSKNGNSYSSNNKDFQHKNKRETYYRKQYNPSASNKSQHRDIVTKQSGFSITDLEFPDLITNVNQTTDTKLDYKNVVNKVTNQTYLTKTVYPGWSTINRKTKQITSYDKYGNIIDRNIKTLQDQTISTKQIYSVYNKMSNRWCEYYDSINQLLGDRSPYINYQDEIDKMVNEDNEMFTKMYENFDDSLSSDDEYLNLED